MEPTMVEPSKQDGPPAAAVGIVYDVVTELHVRQGHLEHPRRTITVNRHLEESGLLARCQRLQCRKATNEELERAHPVEYCDKVEGLYSPSTLAADGEPAVAEGDCLLISGDIFCTQHTALAARAAAGCCVEAVTQVLSGAVQRAFAVVRPPGHHAESSAYMGFCFYNNAAVAAHAALAQGLQRVLVLDWDIHHGNGTQQIFESDPRVLFVSLHRRDKDFYPQGIGFAEEVGSGPGEGFNVNVPWSSKGMGDADYLAAFELILEPIITSFAPELVLVSAGFDAAEGDTLGGCKVSPAGFAAMTQRLQRFAGGKMILVLEGGYSPGVVAECSAAVVSVMLGDPPGPLDGRGATQLQSSTGTVLRKVADIHSKYWPCLRQPTPMKHQLAAFQASIALAGMSLRSTRSTPKAAAAAVPPTISLAEAAAARGKKLGRSQPKKPAAQKRGPATPPAAGAAGQCLQSSDALPPEAQDAATATAVPPLPVVHLVAAAAGVAGPVPAAAACGAATSTAGRSITSPPAELAECQPTSSVTAGTAVAAAGAAAVGLAAPGEQQLGKRYGGEQAGHQDACGDAEQQLSSVMGPMALDPPAGPAADGPAAVPPAACLSSDTFSVTSEDGSRSINGGLQLPAPVHLGACSGTSSTWGVADDESDYRSCHSSGPGWGAEPGVEGRTGSGDMGSMEEDRWTAAAGDLPAATGATAVVGTPAHGEDRGAWDVGVAEWTHRSSEGGSDGGWAGGRHGDSREGSSLVTLGDGSQPAAATGAAGGAQGLAGTWVPGLGATGRCVDGGEEASQAPCGVPCNAVQGMGGGGRCGMGTVSTSAPPAAFGMQELREALEAAVATPLPDDSD